MNIGFPCIVADSSMKTEQMMGGKLLSECWKGVHCKDTGSHENQGNYENHIFETSVLGFYVIIYNDLHS